MTIFTLKFLLMERKKYSTEMCAVMVKPFNPEITFNQQHFLNVWVLAAVWFDISE